MKVERIYGEIWRLRWIDDVIELAFHIIYTQYGNELNYVFVVLGGKQCVSGMCLYNYYTYHMIYLFLQDNHVKNVIKPCKKFFFIIFLY